MRRFRSIQVKAKRVALAGGAPVDQIAGRRILGAKPRVDHRRRMVDRPGVAVQVAVLAVVPDLDFNGVASILAWEAPLAQQREAKVNIEFAAAVIAAGWRRYKEVIHQERVIAAAGEGMKLPDCRPVLAVQREGDFVGGQGVDRAQEEVAGVNVKAVGRNLGFGNDVPG